jgi:hypothetical protein
MCVKLGPKEEYGMRLVTKLQEDGENYIKKKFKICFHRQILLGAVIAQLV